MIKQKRLPVAWEPFVVVVVAGSMAANTNHLSQCTTCTTICQKRSKILHDVADIDRMIRMMNASDHHDSDNWHADCIRSSHTKMIE